MAAERFAIVEQIVGRCHVGESLAEVARYVVSRLKASAVRDMRRTPEGRDKLAKIIRDARAAHLDNRGLYVRVVSGRL